MEKKLLITEDDQENMLAEFIASCEKDGLTEEEYKEVFNTLKKVAEHVREKNG